MAIRMSVNFRITWKMGGDNIHIRQEKSTMDFLLMIKFKAMEDTILSVELNIREIGAVAWNMELESLSFLIKIFTKEILQTMYFTEKVQVCLFRNL